MQPQDALNQQNGCCSKATASSNQRGNPDWSTGTLRPAREKLGSCPRFYTSRNSKASASSVFEFFERFERFERPLESYLLPTTCYLV